MLLPSSRFTPKLEKVVGDRVTNFTTFQNILKARARTEIRAKDLLYEITPVVRGEVYNTSSKDCIYLSINMYQFDGVCYKHYQIKQIHTNTFARKTMRIRGNLVYDDWFIVKVKKCNKEQQDMLENS